MRNRAKRFQTFLHDKRCPRCAEQDSLIQRRPRCYNEARCTSCGVVVKYRARREP